MNIYSIMSCSEYTSASCEYFFLPESMIVEPCYLKGTLFALL